MLSYTPFINFTTSSGIGNSHFRLTVYMDTETDKKKGEEMENDDPGI